MTSPYRQPLIGERGLALSSGGSIRSRCSATGAGRISRRWSLVRCAPAPHHSQGIGSVMGNQVSQLKSSDESAVACLKLLAMSKRVRSSLAEARDMAAAALAAMLKLEPSCGTPEPVTNISYTAYPRYIRTSSGEIQDIADTEDRLVVESIDNSDVRLFYEALLDSAEERIAALTRVLHAPDDNPQEMTSARAELARSKAYPGLLRLSGRGPEVGDSATLTSKLA